MMLGVLEVVVAFRNLVIAFSKIFRGEREAKVGEDGCKRFIDQLQIVTGLRLAVGMLLRFVGHTLTLGLADRSSSQYIGIMDMICSN